jgi:hypothetical protein
MSGKVTDFTDIFFATLHHSVGFQSLNIQPSMKAGKFIFAVLPDKDLQI